VPTAKSSSTSFETPKVARIQWKGARRQSIEIDRRGPDFDQSGGTPWTPWAGSAEPGS
jgi:hypothetical protein